MTEYKAIVGGKPSRLILRCLVCGIEYRDAREKHIYNKCMVCKSNPSYTPPNSEIGEEWRDVVDYEGRYKVSNLGNVKSKKALLRQQPTVTGYLATTLSKGKRGSAKRLVVHRLVAKAFIPNPENKCCVNHIDGNPKNNKSDNLEWVTYKENSEHFAKYLRTGDHYEKIGIRNTKPIVSISDDGVRKYYLTSQQAAEREGFVKIDHLISALKGRKDRFRGLRWEYVTKEEYLANTSPEEVEHIMKVLKN